MNKTIYIRDEDVPVWDHAKELAGDKLSPVIVAGLKQFIAEKDVEEAEAKGFERIELAYADASEHGIPKRKAFYGKWIFPPSKPTYYEEEYAPVSYNFAVAQTAKGSFVIYSWTEDEGDPHDYILSVHPSLEAAASDQRTNFAARKAIEAIGVPVEELDI